MVSITEFLAKALFDAWDGWLVEELAQKLWEERNRVIFEGYPEYRTPKDFETPAHKATYTALAEYILENYEVKK